jgi:hypothetical protein
MNVNGLAQLGGPEHVEGVVHALESSSKAPANGDESVAGGDGDSRKEDGAFVAAGLVRSEVGEEAIAAVVAEHENGWRGREEGTVISSFCSCRACHHHRNHFICECTNMRRRPSLLRMATPRVPLARSPPSPSLPKLPLSLPQYEPSFVNGDK